MSPEITVIVPCLNEQGAIADTLDSLIAALEEFSYEIVVVDDGSSDASNSAKLFAVSSGVG